MKPKYYYNKGAIYLKSKWPFRFKVFVGALLLAGALTITSNSPAPNLKTFTEQKLTYVEYIQETGKIPRNQAIDITNSIIRWSSVYNLDEKLVLAVAKIESRFDKHAISNTGAMGIMQVIPSWHRDKIQDAKKQLGNPEVFNINTNIYLGARVLSDCLNKFKQTNKALSCYSGNTPGYEKKVLAEYNVIKEL